MRSDPPLWNALLTRLTDVTAEYLRGQIDAGAQAVALFDSWIGCLNPFDYRESVLPHMKRLFDQLPKSAPASYFGTGTASFLEDFASAGSAVVGVDFHVPLDVAWKRIGGAAIQGNLDPTVLFSDPQIVKREAGRILDQAGGRPGHIFNLGHGILPNTPVDHVRDLVRYVHEASSRR